MKNKRSTLSGAKQLSSRVAQQKVGEYLAATVAKNTRLAYSSDVAHFLRAGGKIPANPRCVAAYLATYASTLSVATLNRRVIAIGRAHVAKGLVSPTGSALVAATLRGIRRVNGSAQRRVAPLLKADLLRIVRGLSGIRGVRDKALLLTGFAAAFRRSELVALQVDDLSFVPQGVIIRLQRGKTDQSGRGRDIAVPYVRGANCPVRALAKWLSISGITTGHLFRPIDRYGQIGKQGLGAPSVALIVKQRAADAGLDPGLYSGHSLRAGFVTSAARAGVSGWKICQQTDHKSVQMMRRYIRDSQLFVDNAVAKIW